MSGVYMRCLCNYEVDEGIFGNSENKYNSKEGIFC